MSLKLGEGNRINSQQIIANSGNTYGTNYSYLGVGGFYELSNTQERNEIPIDSLSLMNSDGRSSGRRRLGMIVHTIQDNKYWQLLPQLKIFYRSGNQTFTVFDSTNRVTETIWNTLKDSEKLVLLDPKAQIFDSTTNRFYFGSGNASTAWYDTPLQVYITGGTYNSGTTTLSLFDTSGNTISITGVKSPDVTITAFTYNALANTFTIRDSRGSVFNATIDSVNGFTVNGTLNANIISANTYLNLPVDPDTKVVDFDYLNNNLTIKDNFGNEFKATINNMTGLTVTGTLNANTIFANNYQNLPPDSDRYVTGFTYSNNNFSIKDNSGSTFNALFNTVTGLTINGNLNVTGNTTLNVLSATTISGGTFFGNGSGLTNVQNIYNNDGTLQSNRVVDFNGNFLSFQSNTPFSNNKNIIFSPNAFPIIAGYDSSTSISIGKTTADTVSEYTVDLGDYSNLRINSNGTFLKSFFYNDYRISDFQVGKYPNYNLQVYGSNFPNQQTISEGYNVAFYGDYNYTNIGHVNSVTSANGGGMRSKMIIGHHPTFFHGLTIAQEWLKNGTDNQQPSSLQVASTSRRPIDNSNTVTLWLKHYGNNGVGPRILFEKDRTQSENWGYGTNSLNIQAGDVLMDLLSRVSMYDTSATTSPTRLSTGRIAIIADTVTASPGAHRIASSIRFFNTDGISPFNTERSRITPTGNFLIGTTTDSGFRLDVNGTGRFANTLRLDTVNLSTDTKILTLSPSNIVQYQNLSTITAATSADTYTTGFTYLNNTFTLRNNSGQTLNATINTVTGLTVNGNLNVTGNTVLNNLSANTISGTTISGGTFFGNGSGLTNVQNIYNSDGFLTNNRILDLSGKTLSIKRSSNLNDPFLTFLDSSGNTMFEIRSQFINSGSTDNRNIFIGKDSGILNTTGTRNVTLGTNTLTGNTTGDQNTAIGSEAGKDHVSGLWNTFIGSRAGMMWVNGNDNTVIGQNSAHRKTGGTENTLIGNEINNGNYVVTITGGTGNTVMGAYSARFMQGDNNVIIGRRAGMSLTTGAGNIFIGRNAGNPETTNSNLLYIENSNTSTPLIWGDFANDLLRFNGKVGVNVQPSTYQFDVNGTSRFSNTVQLDLVNSSTTDTKILTLNSGNVIQYRNFSDFSGSTGISGDYLPISGGTVTGNTIFQSGLTANTISGGTFFGNGSNLDNIITGATNLGTGLTIFDSVSNKTIRLNSITGDSQNKITTTLSSNTIQLGINEQNLSIYPLVVQGNRLISGSVSYVSGLTFSVSPLQYIINGQIYSTSASTLITLTSGDTNFDRLDVIVATTAQTVTFVSGTPSSNPEKPSIDNAVEIEVTFVLVPQNAVTPSITNSVIYNEFVGQPTEWQFSSNTANIVGNSTLDSYIGTYSILVSAVTGSYVSNFRLSAATIFDTDAFTTLQFSLKNRITNNNNNTIRLRFLDSSGLQNGTTVILDNTNINLTNTTTWQLISVPLWRFNLTSSSVRSLEVAFRAQGANQSNYFLDYFEFLQGFYTTPPTNAWISIKGDGPSIITAPSPSSLLTISGGTNIGSSINILNNSVVIDLDNNISLNSVSATTMTGGTFFGNGSGLTNVVTSITAGSGLSANTTTGNITLINTAPDQTVTITGGTNIEITGSYPNFGVNFTGTTSGVSGNYLPISGGTVTGDTIFQSGLTANTISATTYLNLPTDLYTTGFTFNPSNYDLTIKRNGGLPDLTQSLAILASDLTVTGGTYDPNTGVATFTNNTGGTFNVSGFTSGLTDTVITAYTYSSNTFTIGDSSGNTFNATINDVTGLTVNGVLTITATTGQTFGVINFGNNSFIHNYGTGNTYVGSFAGSFSGTGSDNTGIGEFVLNDLISGDDNTGLGALSLTDLTGGTFNTALGAGSLQNLINGDNNTAVGVGSNALLQSGSGNTSLGFQSLFNNINGYGNVAIGNKAGYSETGNNKLYIANNDITTLIYGEFDTQKVGINTTSPTNMFHVAGSIDPVRFEGLQLSSDTRVVTTDSNGVLHYINLSGVTSGYLPLSGGTVTGDTIFQSGLTANTISATTYLNLPPDIYTTGFTYSSNTFSISDNSGSTFNATINDVTGFTVNGVLTVTGNTFVQDMTGRTAVFSSSSQNVVTIIGSGNSTSSPLFSVIGSQGELFSVSDSLNGSLFSVNDISGLPVLEVFSDDRILMGSYLAPSLNSTKKITLTAGTNTVYQIPTSAYTGAFFEYTLISTGATGARAGSIMSIWSGTTAQFTEVTTNDIGSTTGVTFTVGVSGNNAVLSSSATTSGWILKVIIRSI